MKRAFRLLSPDNSRGKIKYAGVVELVDSMDLGSITFVVCGFESRRPHHNSAGATGGLPVFYARVRAVPLINGSCDANALIRLPFSSSTQLCSPHIRSTPFG